MRKLVTRDVLECCRCLKVLGLKEKLRQISTQADSAQDVWNLGYDVIWDLFDAATEAKGESALYAFLAGPFELTAEELASLPLPELLDGLNQLVKENDLGRFFKFVELTMKSN